MEKLKEILLKFFKLESIVSNITGYVEARVALVKMELREEVAGVISRGLIIIIMMLIGFLLILFLSIGMAGYLNTMFEGNFAGFFLVGGFYGLLLLLLILFRKNLMKSLEKKFTTMIRQKQD
jgi:phosphoglycerol transferase MdoB-like AlkP superfamily enzyme